MIHIEESDPIGENTSSFKPRDVQIIYGKDPKQQFELLTEIGRGKFGTVYRCKEKESDLIVAAKFIPIPKREDRRNVEREVEIMNSLQHHLIIQLYAAFEYKKMMCVVQELVEGGELFDRVIDDDFVLTEKACSVFVRQICQAMEFIHRNKIIHLDLKPENILCLTREGNRIKIIDFGLARKFDPDKKLQVLFGTPEFVAPEVVNFDQITFGTDMWSIGVICYVLISGLSPFMGETDIATMANVTIAKYDFDDEAFANVSEDALDFINKLLIKDSKSRMTASKCLEHRWLKQKPSVPPKPKVVIPPKIITEPPAQIVNGLDKTKENLKNFIERWEEHPNSPYVFDTGNHLISPIIDDVKNSNSVLSSRGCSPSPCGSISSTPERELPQPVEYERPLPLSPPIVMSPTTTRNGRKPRPRSELFSFKSEEYDDSRSAPFKEYLQSFERRNSDSNFLTNKSNSTEKLNLAEEIKKLSERLLMLSSINTQPERKSDEIITKPTTNGTAKPDGVVSVKPSIREKTDEVKSIAIARRNEFMNGQSSDMKQESRFNFMNGGSSTASMRSSFTRSSSVGSSVFKSSTSSVQSQQVFSSSRNGHVRTLNEHLKSIEETPTISSGMTSRKSVIREESQSIEDSATAFGGGGVPWPITNRRTKFRISQLSRDVPVGLPDTHQNLEVTASTTKDCLLHLLEKYNETTSKEKHRHSGIGGRHQSISVEWGLSDNLEYQSINSLNAFFQRNSKNMGNQVRQIQSKIESKNNAI